ncbi:MAG: hypothetical protein IKX53_05990 [Bacteroidales bacterium]|nr:hypothetical protein [Bacteroidales bacterium]
MKQQRTTHTRQRMHRLPALLTILLLALPMGGSQAAAQGLIGVRLSGGAAWCFGSSFENASANGANVIQPMAGVGVTVKVAPRFRAGVGYDYTRMVREQLNGQLTPIAGSVLPGSVEGTVYRDLKTHFHAVGVTAEYDVLPAGGLLSLYVGTGAGCLVGNGNIWSLSIRNEMRSDNWTNTVSVGGHNEALRYAAPFIPAALSLECRILPRTAVCIGGVYRLLLSKEPLAPNSQAGATLGLRLDF